MSQACKMYDSYNEYGPQGYVASDRFYVRSTVFLPSSEVDPRTGMLRNDQSREENRRHARTQAMRMEADRLNQEYEQLDEALQKRRAQKGIRVSLRGAMALLLTMVVILGTILLIQQGMLVQKLRSAKTASQRIEEIRDVNASLTAQIAEASDAATICYAAARDLGMVPAESAQAIHLTAVDTRPSGPSQDVNVTADAQTAPIQ